MAINKKIVFLFSGQGSQYSKMGCSLYEHNAIFKRSLEQSEDIVQKHLSRSLIRELYSTIDVEFNDLLITHPAIVAVEIAIYQVLKDMGIKPDYVSGSSLGEFAAAVVSGIWDAETALVASIEQSKFVVESGVRGGMLAVINQAKIDLKSVYLKHNLFLASDNFEGHITLSGSSENLDNFQLELKKMSVQFVRLPVLYPFHSPLMANSLGHFNQYMRTLMPLGKPKSGFISGVKCRELDEVSDNYFTEVVDSYSNFSAFIKYTESRGPCFYIDLGPSGTSAVFAKYNLGASSGSDTFQIMTPFRRELEALEKLKTLTNSLI